MHNLFLGPDGALWASGLRSVHEPWCGASTPDPVALGRVAAGAVSLPAGPLPVTSRAHIEFGDALPGDGPRQQPVGITNAGLAPLVVDSASVQGEHPAAFAIAGEDFSGVEIGPGSYCTITLRFTPTGPGRRRARLLVSTNAGSLEIGLEGQGVPSLPQLVEAPSPGPAGWEAPFKVTAIGRCSTPAIRPGACELRHSPGGSLLVQEFTITLPVEVTLAGCEAEPASHRLVLEQVIRAALPVTMGRAGESPADCTLCGGTVRTVLRASGVVPVPLRLPAMPS